MSKATWDAFPDLLDTRFRMAYVDLNTLPLPMARLFTEIGTTKGYEKFTEVAMGGYLQVKNRSASSFEGTIYQAYDKTLTPTTYSKQYRFEWEAFADDQFGAFQLAPTSLAQQGIDTQELTKTAILDAGIAGTDTGPDGVSWLNASHPMQAGGTFGNKPGTDIDLSPTAIHDGLIAYEKLPDHFNKPKTGVPRFLVIATNEKYNAKRYLQSNGLPGSANNDLNPWQGELEIVSSPILTDTDAWVILGEPAVNGLTTLMREQINLDGWDRDRDTRDLVVSAFGRWTDGYLGHSPSHAYGSTGG